MENISAVVSDLLLWSLIEAESDEQVSVVQQAVASIINKRLAGTVKCNMVSSYVYSDICALDLTDFMENHVPAFWDREIAGASGESSRRRRGLDAYTWVRITSSQIKNRRRNPCRLCR